MFPRLIAVALLAAAAVVAEETVIEAAATAAEACAAPGAVPHPEDAGRLVVCGGPGRLVAVVRCPDGYTASAAAATCEPPAPPPAPRKRQPARRQATSASPNTPAAPAPAAAAPAPAAPAAPAAAPAPVALAAATPTPTPPPTWPGGADPGCEAGPGLRCAGCDNLLVCAVGQGGRVAALANVSCSATTAGAGAGTGPGAALVCDSQRRVCAEAAAGTSCPGANAGAFHCLQQGAFPDPEDCRRYHLCDGPALTHFSDICDVAYNPDLSICVADGIACNTLTSSPPACTTDAAAAIFPGYGSFYRVCLPQSPRGYRNAVLRCPDKQTFDPKTGTCSFVCSAQRGRFPDPLDCRAFFDCPGDVATPTVPKRGMCSEGLAFDEKRHMCVQQASVTTCVQPIKAPPSPVPAVAPATASAVTPVVAPALVPAVAPAGTTPTVVATGIPPKPAAPQVGVFSPDQCTREGVFPDPDDCRRYIICSRGQVAGPLLKTVRYCPLFMSYNVRTRTCWFSFCF